MYQLSTCQSTEPYETAAMRRGELSLRQLCEWSARGPHEVPRVNGEFEFIAALTPEAAD